MKKKKQQTLSTTHIIMLSFLIVILLGSILLTLPISSATGESVSYIDALFTATTATCVTGLVTVPTYSTWSFFGHVVILVLIQIGGLGIITILTGLALFLHRRMGLGYRMLLQDAFNLNSLSGLVGFVKKVFLGTFVVEMVGAGLYMTVFVPEFGWKTGIWYSIFHSISAFCNAGIDLLGEVSLSQYATNPIINFTTCALIALGGLGYIVWWDLLYTLKNFKKKKWKTFKGLSLHSRIVLFMTGVLILGGALLILIFECNNPQTMGQYSFFEKLELALFQSVTTRTAGFFTMPQEHLTTPTVIVSLVLMFIGGSPVGTAGGIKTVTLAALVASSLSTIKNKNEITLLDRNISGQTVRKAIAVLCMSSLITLLSTFLLSIVCDASLLDLMYETVSAAATVGLTRNLTSTLNVFGKLIIIMTMYLGRVGPISLAIAFQVRKENQNIIKNPMEEISVG